MLKKETQSMASSKLECTSCTIERKLHFEHTAEIAREKLRFLDSLGVGKEAITTACGVNRRTVYNWLNNRSQKIPFLAAEKILKISNAFAPEND